MLSSFSLSDYGGKETFVSEVESRTQHSRPRPRTQKKYKAKAKDRIFEDKTSRGQEQKWSRSRPRTEDTIFLNYGR